jgi:RimJ/RimL family protein N-acetyltransferase
LDQLPGGQSTIARLREEECKMIYGKGIRLRAIEREDIPTFLRWFNDPEVREGLLMFGPMGRAEVFDFNRRAVRAYEKAGFRLEGTRRQSHYHAGTYHDAHIMAVLRDEFMEIAE